MEFSYSINESGSDAAELSLNGYFDEFATLPSDTEIANLKTLFVDFEKVNFINSGGIKLWVNFIDSVDSIPNLKVYYRKCHRVIVDQINLINGFLPKNGEILSLYVPIFCNKCENSYEVFLDLKRIEEDYPNLLENVDAAKSCENYPRCVNDFEVDILKNQYFNFMKK